MANWRYTTAERRAIDRAFHAVSYVVDHTGDAATLTEAYRYERRERSCGTVARALIVAGFWQGRKRNPRADEISYYSAGIMRATILGAKSRGREFPGNTISATLRALPRLTKAAAAAHDDYMRRGVASAAAG